MANGRGTVYMRAGQWTIGFTVNGTRVRETIGPNKHFAEMVLKKRLTEAMENRYFSKRNLGRVPFREFGQMYLERSVPMMKSARSERLRVLWWMKYFGTRPLGQITHNELAEFQRLSSAKRRPATTNRNLGRLRRMLHVAVQWRLLEESPMKGLKFLRENNARKRYLSIEECGRLIDSCRALHIRAIATIALHTGMRLGEILSLRRRDIDFAAGLILIPDSKNGEPRHIPMDSTVLELLTNYPHNPTSDLLFTNAAGTKLKDIRQGFGNTRRRAGLTDLRFHDLRHTFSSHWMMAGGDLYMLKEILGHKSITMTQRYAHLSPQFKKAAIGKMNTIWAVPPTPQVETSGAACGPIPVTTASQNGI